MLNISQLSNWTQCEFYLNKTERVLTGISATVVLAPVSGMLKCLLGTITVLACAIFCIHARVIGDEKLGERAFSVLRHGAGNVLSGIVEIIPFAGLALFIHRYWQSYNFALSRGGIFIHTHDQDKYMPYASIARQNFEITSGMDGSSEELDRVRSLFEQKYPDAKVRDNTTLEEMYSDFEHIESSHEKIGKQ